eukprot:5632269-Amphidinium_carterae.2
MTGLQQASAPKDRSSKGAIDGSVPSRHDSSELPTAISFRQLFSEHPRHKCEPQLFQSASK